MKLFLLLFLILIPFLDAKEATFSSIIKEQIKFVNLVNHDDATQESIMKLTKEQKEFYSSKLEDIMVNKKRYFNSKVSHVSEIYAIEKIIKLNKRRGNKYAVIRDEVIIKSYKILDLQTIMIRDILNSLDDYTYTELQVKMSEIFTQNQIRITALDTVNYNDILKIVDDSKVIKEVQKTIKDYF